ncbi:MAG: AI-2E family transporter [Acidobacteria bacterium]|nr:MAG: AI-2E family transporter [Acidobacteriota bacterium]
MAFPHSGPSRNPLELGARGIVRETHLAAHPSWWLVFDIHLIAFGANRGLSTLLNSCGQVVAEATGVPRRGYPILVTLAVEGHGAAVILLGYVLNFQLLENSWLSPKLSVRTMSLSGGLVFASALAGGSLAGPVGAFLVLPTAALISSFITKSRPDLRGGLLGWGERSGKPGFGGGVGCARSLTFQVGAGKSAETHASG